MADWKSRSEMRVLGKPHPRLDGPGKATGHAKYAADINLPGLLHGRIFRSEHANAIIERIDTSAAERMPGVKAVIVTAEPGTRALFAGQELGALAAESVDIAEDAVRAIKVAYRVLPHAVQEQAAMEPDAPAVLPNGPNVAPGASREQGSVDEEFQKAAATIEGTYSVAVRTHCSLEPHGVTCRWDAPDRLTCWASTQGVFSVRDELAGALQLPAENVLVITEVMGGGFGSKFGAGYEGVMCARLAQKAGAPVKLMLTRQEEQIAVGNAPSATAKIKMAADREGRITAVAAEIHGTGGIAGAGVPFPYIYRVGSSRVKQSTARTNAGGARAWRAPGHTQASFLMESALEDLAAKLGMDPLEMRIANDPNELRKAEWREGARLIGWQRRNPKPGQGPLAGTGRFRRGLGCAAAVWGGGGNDGAQARVVIHRDGTVLVENGVQDIGTGTRTYCAMIVAEELGIPTSRVTANIGKTNLGYGAASGGSVTTGSTAPAIKRAAEDAKAALFKVVAGRMGVSPDDLVAEGGRIYPQGDPSKGIPFQQACSALPMSGAVGTGKWDRSLQQSGVAGAQFAEVEVDTLTGRIQVIKMVGVQDGGIILNPLTYTSQINGGIIQGIGMALLEDRIMCQVTGRMVNPDMEWYKLPGSREMPEFVPVAFENPTAKGVSGIGEPPVIPTAAAIRNAVLNATGARVNDAPMTPARVLAALAAARRA